MPVQVRSGESPGSPAAGWRAVAHALDRAVIAEGVGTAAQLDALRELGCDRAQGYLIGRPMPGPEFEQLLRSWGRMPRLAAA
ncbi:MAG: EAL domain-containing protein [Dehalococcoidia bacterium]|nr:EAL domain-containing protein [Dehalococcoidia bacterium]